MLQCIFVNLVSEEMERLSSLQSIFPAYFRPFALDTPPPPPNSLALLSPISIYVCMDNPHRTNIMSYFILFGRSIFEHPSLTASVSNNDI
jgi:hypothetical protein